MAARYRKIDTRIWNDAKFNSFSDRAKLLFLFLLTHPHMTSLGAMRASVPGLADELGWDEKGFREGLGELLRKGLVKHSERGRLIVIAHFLKYNAPENPNVVKSWRTCWDLLPECELKVELYQQVREFVETLPKGFREPFRNGMPNPEHEPEPEQEPEPEPEPEQEQEQEIAMCVSEKRTVRTKRSANNRNGYSATFERFWSEYPRVRRRSKADAWKAWQVVTRSVDPETIIDAAREYAASPLGSGQFSKMPATWIRQRCWEDDRETWQWPNESSRGAENRATVERTIAMFGGGDDEQTLDATGTNGHSFDRRF